MEIKLHKTKYKHSQWYYYLKPKRITLKSNQPIYKWLFWIFIPNKKEYQKIQYKQGQRTFIYCPKCDFELISSNSHKYMRKDGIEVFKCKKCGYESEWDFDFICPILLKKGEQS